MSAKEFGIARDVAVALALTHVADKPTMIRRHWKIEKYQGDFKEAKDIPASLKPLEVVEFEGNLLLNEGINELWTLVCAATATRFDNTNAYIGVGDSATAADASARRAFRHHRIKSTRLWMVDTRPTEHPKKRLGRPRSVAVTRTGSGMRSPLRTATATRRRT